MVSTPTGLGVSPGWTKTQATEQADHRTENTCGLKDVFLPNLYLNSARVTNQNPVKKDNTKYYTSCHRKVLKGFTTITRQMSFPSPKRVGHIYNGKLPLLNYDTTTENQYNRVVETNEQFRRGAEK